jgi:hypothetical protein
MSKPSDYYAGQPSPDVKGVSKPTTTPAPKAPKPARTSASNLINNIPQSMGSGGNVWGSPMGKQLLPMAGMLASQNPLLGGSILAAGLGPKDWQTLMSGSESSPTLGGFSSSAVKNFRNKVEPPKTPNSNILGSIGNAVGSAASNFINPWMSLGRAAGGAIGNAASGLPNPFSLFQKRSQDNAPPITSPSDRPVQYTPLTTGQIQANQVTMPGKRMAAYNSGDLDRGTAAALQNAQIRQGLDPGRFGGNPKMVGKDVNLSSQQWAEAFQKQMPDMTPEQVQQYADIYHRAGQQQQNAPSYWSAAPAMTAQWDGGITPLSNWLMSGSNPNMSTGTGKGDEYSWYNPVRAFPGLVDNYKGKAHQKDEYIGGLGAHNQSRHYFERAPEVGGDTSRGLFYTRPFSQGFQEGFLDLATTPGREVGMYSGHLARLHPQGWLMNAGMQGVKAPFQAANYLRNNIPGSPAMRMHFPGVSAGQTGNMAQDMANFVKGTKATPPSGVMSAFTPGKPAVPHLGSRMVSGVKNAPLVQAVKNPAAFARASQEVAGTGKVFQGLSNLGSKLPGVAGRAAGAAPVAAAKLLGPAAGVATILGDPAMNYMEILKANPEEMAGVLGNQSQGTWSDSYDKNTGLFGSGAETYGDSPWYGKVDKYMGQAVQGMAPWYAIPHLAGGVGDVTDVMGLTQGAGESIRGKPGEVWNGSIFNPQRIDLSSDVAKMENLQNAQARLDWATNRDNKGAVNALIAEQNERLLPTRNAITQQMTQVQEYDGAIAGHLALANPNSNLHDPRQFAAFSAQAGFEEPKDYLSALQARKTENAAQLNQLQGQINANTYTYDRFTSDLKRNIHKAEVARDTASVKFDASREGLERDKKQGLTTAKARLKSLEQSLDPQTGRFRQDPDAMANSAVRDSVTEQLLASGYEEQQAQQVIDLYYQGPDAWIDSASKRSPVYTNEGARREAIEGRNAFGAQMDALKEKALADISANNEEGQALDKKWQEQQARELEQAKQQLPRAQQDLAEAKSPLEGVTLNKDTISRAMQQRDINVNKAKSYHTQMKKMKSEFGGNYSSWSPEQRDQFDTLARSRHNALGALRAIDKVTEVYGGGWSSNAPKMKKLQNNLGQSLNIANQYEGQPRSGFTELAQYMKDIDVDGEQIRVPAETDEQFKNRQQDQLQAWTDVRNVGAENRGAYDLLRRLAAQESLNKSLVKKRTPAQERSLRSWESVSDNMR